MFVVSAIGYLHGPFETANDAAQFGSEQQNVGPWTIIPIKSPPDQITNQVSINDTEGGFGRARPKAVSMSRFTFSPSPRTTT